MDILLSTLKSRTVWFAMILAALSVVQGYLNVFNLDPKSEMLAGVAIAMAITVLRIITTQPLIQK
jgi:hypothetical protein